MTYPAVYTATYPGAALAAAIGVLGGRAVSLTNYRPGAGNTGVSGTYSGLTPSGNLTVTTNGATISGLDIAGSLTIAADNVTVQNCRIRAVQDSATTYTVTWGNVSGRPPTGLTVIDSELDGNGRNGGDTGPYPSGWAQSAAVQPGIGYTLRRCDIHGQTDGLKPQDNPTGSSIVIDACWVHDLTTYYSAAGNITHNDVLQIAGTGAHDVTIRRCHLNGYRAGDGNIESRYASSSLMQWGSFPGAAGVLTNILIEGNWIDGGGYASRLDFDTAATVTNLVIRNNRHGLRHRFGVYRQNGLNAVNGGSATLSGNVWDVAGTTDSGLTVTAGQSV